MIILMTKVGVLDMLRLAYSRTNISIKFHMKKSVEH
jgi:hypothetical protein